MNPPTTILPIAARSAADTAVTATSVTATSVTASESTIEQLQFSHPFGALGPLFSTLQMPTPLPNPRLAAYSPEVAALCGVTLDTNALVAVFSGNRLPSGCTPRAAVYSGHQFGVWAGQLGDGRAISLGQLSSQEVQLKGAGPTPYSRGADGRAVLRSSIREFLCSEAMAGLGIPTTRALCMIASDMHMMREEPEPTAVLARVAPGFVRFGSFEHWYSRGDAEALRTLTDFVILHHFPELLIQEKNRYAALLKEVTTRTAHLMAQWQTVGFMHGVMNTDNMSILGLTLDYGPFGFMESFNPHHICNHSDHQGRYSYAMQPKIGRWNCHALGQALLPLIGSVDATNAALEGYEAAYQRKVEQLWCAKLGITPEFDPALDPELDPECRPDSHTPCPDNAQLISGMLSMMQLNQLDFTRFFRSLGDIRSQDNSQDYLIRDYCPDLAAFDDWITLYRQRLVAEAALLPTSLPILPTSLPAPPGTATATHCAASLAQRDAARRNAMNRCNPKFVLRNYLAQYAIEAAHNHDYSGIEQLRQILAHPFDEQPEHEAYADLPPDWARTLSVSCSS